MMILRPVALNDLESLFSLAVSVAPGMTTFPPDREILSQKITDSIKSFQHNSEARDFLLVMENTQTSKIVGTAGIYGNLGATKPFFSFAKLPRTLYHRSLNVKASTNTLHLVNAYDGDTEVGTLILSPEVRGGGLGQLLAKSRYLLIAQFRHMFGPRVIAELRGWSDEQAVSPFWEEVGKVFFKGLSYTEADLLSATTNNQFITDLMPTHEICCEMLSRRAREVIGKPHDKGVNALKMLYKEGFRYENIVDIFDAGPTVHAEIDDIHTVKNSRECRVSGYTQDLSPAQQLLACNSQLQHFRVGKINAQLVSDDQVLLSQQDAETLKVAIGDTLRIYPYSS